MLGHREEVSGSAEVVGEENRLEIGDGRLCQDHNREKWLKKEYNRLFQQDVFICDFTCYIFDIIGYLTSS